MLSAFLLVLTLAPARAGEPAALCDAAARQAATATGVPVEILLAISRVETGRGIDGRLQPWPWTSNIGGEGRWHDTAAQARAHISRALSNGHQNIDIGCYQINHRWHADGFDSLDQMLSPVPNALYAAGFLRRLFAEFGSWDRAVAAYHSRTPHHGIRYIARYHDVLANMGDNRPANAQPPPDPTGPRPLELSPRRPLAGARIASDVRPPQAGRIALTAVSVRPLVGGVAP